VIAFYAIILSEESKIEARTTAALEQAYITLQEIVANLYAEADQAIMSDKYADASLLQSQADSLYQISENLGILISEVAQ